MMTFSGIVRMFSLGALDLIHFSQVRMKSDRMEGWSFDFHIGWMKDEM